MELLPTGCLKEIERQSHAACFLSYFATPLIYTVIPGAGC